MNPPKKKATHTRNKSFIDGDEEPCYLTQSCQKMSKVLILGKLSFRVLPFQPSNDTSC